MIKNPAIVFVVAAGLGLAGCASQKDFTQLQSNVDTASEGDWGTCIQAVHTGASNLEDAKKVLQKGQERGRLSKSEYEKGLRKSESAVRNRQIAEETCEIRVAALEQRVQRTKEVLRGVTFATGSATLSRESKSTLDVVANRLLRQPTRVEVQGHTSNTGSLEVNMRLSQERADAVRDYLISEGVTEESITANGYGPEQPIASNDTPEGRRANQRVELVYEQEIE